MLRRQTNTSSLIVGILNAASKENERLSVIGGVNLLLQASVAPYCITSATTLKNRASLVVMTVAAPDRPVVGNGHAEVSRYSLKMSRGMAGIS